MPGSSCTSSSGHAFDSRDRQSALGGRTRRTRVTATAAVAAASQREGIGRRGCLMLITGLTLASTMTRDVDESDDDCCCLRRSSRLLH